MTGLTSFWMARKPKGKQQNFLSLLRANVIYLLGFLLVLLALFLYSPATQQQSQPIGERGIRLPPVNAVPPKTLTPREKIIQLQSTYHNSKSKDVLAQIDSLYSDLFLTYSNDWIEDDIQWLTQVIKSASSFSIAAEAAIFLQHSLEEVVNFFDKTIELSADKGGTLPVFAYDRLSRVLVREIPLPTNWTIEEINSNIYKYMRYAIEHRNNDMWLNRYYGIILQTLMYERKMEEALVVTEECISELKELQYVPYHCFHQKATLLVWTGKINEAVTVYRHYFKLLVEKNWQRENGAECQIKTHFPVSLQHFDYDSLPNPSFTRREIIFPKISQLECSNQEWPNYLQYSAQADKYYPRKYQYTDFDYMKCLNEDYKKPMLYTIPNAYIKGPMKLVSQEFLTEKNEYQCTVFTFSFAYQNGFAQPRLTGLSSKPYPELPLRKFNKLLIFPFLDTNYYHFSIEAVSQLLLALHYTELEQDPELKIMVSSTTYAVEFFTRLQYNDDRVIIYEPDNYRYFAKELYLVDWVWEEDEEEEYTYHPEDYYVPPANVLQLLHEIATLMGQRVADPNTPNLRNKVVFLSREMSSQTRVILNAKELIERLKSACEEFGVEFAIHSNDNNNNFLPVEKQYLMFSEAVVVIGTHGAGLANIVACQKGTSVIELPADPPKVSVYSRLASALDLDYWTVPSIKVFAFGDMSIEERMIQQCVETLKHILRVKGF